MNDKTKSPRKARWLALGLLGVALLGAGVWAFRPRPLGVETAPATLARFEQAVEEDGVLRLQQRYAITAPVTGELQRPTLKVGDRVRAGEVVARLLPAAPVMIDTRTRAVLAQRVGSAEAARAAAGAQVQRLRTALEQARLESQRAQQLARDNFIAPSARDAAVLAEQAAQQGLQAGLAEQRAADFALAEARAALQGAQQPEQGQPKGLWSVASPVDGVVVQRHRDSAGPVAAGTALLDIGDTAQVEAVIDVLSGDARRIALGAPARLDLGGGAAPLAGHVTRVEPVAFTKVSALGIEEQRVNVVVGLDQPPPDGIGLGEGFRVDARITLSVNEGVLTVPSAALMRQGSGWRVVVVDGGRARVREVSVQDRNADAAWIAQGLREGERVVLYPGATLKDGQRVAERPWTADKP
jgi:HlyD family secretion protein